LILFEAGISTVDMCVNSMNSGFLMLPMRLRRFGPLFDPVSLAKRMKRLLIDKILTFLGALIIKERVGWDDMGWSE